MKKLVLRFFLILNLSLTLISCGGGGGGGGGTSGSGAGSSVTTSASINPNSVGLFVDAPTAGLAYTCIGSSGTAGTSGTTNAQGQFSFTPGASCTFSVGNVTVGSINSIPSDGVVTPQDAAGVSRTFTTDPGVQVIAQFLQSIGSTTSNGLSIPTTMHQTLGGVTPTSLVGSGTVLSQNDLTTLVTTVAGKALVSPEIASSTLAAQIQAAGINLSAGVISANTPSTLVNIAVNAPATSNAVGLSEQLKASGNYTDGTTVNLTNSVSWSSSNPSVVSVSPTGVATSKSAGTATVSAASSSGVIGSVALTVTPATLVSVAVTPASTLPLGLTQQLNANGTYSDGSTKPILTGVTWISSNTLDTVSSSGVFIGKAVGDTTITAYVGNISGSTKLSVTAAALKSIKIISPNSATSAPIGLAEQLTSLGTYTDGSTANLNNLVTWSSNAFASVNTGLMSGTQVGTAVIGATYQGITGTLSMAITDATLQSISLTAQTSSNSPTPSSAPMGFTQNLIATGSYNNGTTKDVTANVTWSSANQSVATVNSGSLGNSGGLVTSVSQGTSVITASLGTLSTQVTFSVTSPVLTSIVIGAANNFVSIGTTDELTATGIYSDNSRQNISSSVTWTASDSAYASIASIGSAGVLTGIAPGSAQITATLNGVSSTSLGVTIIPRVGQFIDAPVVGLTYTCGSFTGTTNGLGQFYYAPGNTCTFSVGNVTVATLPQIPSDGFVTPQDAAGVSRTSTSDPNVQVIAQFLQSVGFSSGGTLTISNNVSQSLASAGVSTTNLLTPAGPISQSKLSALVAASNSGQSLVSPATASSVLAAQIQAAGVNTSIGIFPAISPAIRMDAITVNSPTIISPSGLGVQLSASANFTDGKTSDLTASVTWSSSNPAVMTVSPSGVATGISAGVATISAQTNNGFTNSVTITVTSASLVSIAVTPGSISAPSSVPIGLTQQMIATGTYTDGSIKPITSGVTWSTSNASASISSTGVLKGVSTGNVTVSVTAGSGSGPVSGSTLVRVSPALLQSISVGAPSTATSSPLGLSQQLSAVGSYSDGTSSNLANLVTWTTSSGGSVTSSGVFTGLNTGNQTITAQYLGVSGTLSLMITGAQLQSISITAVPNSNAPTPSSAAKGFSQQLIAMGSYNNTLVDITKTVTWSSDTTGTATVLSGSSGGLVSGLSPGTANITASLSGVSNTVSFTVLQPTLVSIAVTPVNGSTNDYVGSTLNLTAVGTYSDNSTQNLTTSVAWSSSSSSASVSSGILMGVASGSSNVSATYAGVTSQSLTFNVSPAPVFIGGTVSGLLSSQSVTLLNNFGDPLVINGNNANVAFTMPSSIAYASRYSITIGSQPSKEICTLFNNSGNALTNIVNISVACTPNQYTVSTLVGPVYIPAGMMSDTLGNLFLGANLSQIQKITPSGVASVVTGSSSVQGLQNGQGPTVSFNGTTDVAVDQSGNLYVADTFNNAIRKITGVASGNPMTSTLAGPTQINPNPQGTTTAGSTDGTGSQAKFHSPSYLTVDPSGNVYVSDTGNNKIRVITPAGVVSTLAGSGSVGSQNGQGSAATFATPMGIAVDNNANVYVADNQNCLIRKISASGSVSTFAGNGTCVSTDGVGTNASLMYPMALTIDPNGNLFVTDTVSPKIRKITPQGVVVTIAGTGVPGYNNGIGTSATFKEFPQGIAVDASGNVYVSDTGNNSIRKITPSQ
jgi:uncharacterized protein YjdB